MRIQPVIRYFAYMLLALMMPLVIILSSTLHYAFDSGFFLKAFEADKTAELLGLDRQGMTQVVDNMTGYLSGRVNSMDIQVPIHGTATRFYNDRELAHMVDVRNLMDLGQNVRSALLFLSLLILTLLRRFVGKEAFWRGLLASSLGALGFAAILEMLAVSDFSGAFYKFHEIFFTNNLWLLDPATDRLIQMLPESIFYSITAHILTVSGATVLLMGGAAVFGLHCSRKVSLEDGHADNH